MSAVSVYCLTYNHEAYIRRTLEGFVRQETDFDFEVIVHDDASTDGTARIIREFEKKHPDIIRPVLQTQNQWSRGVQIVERYIWPRVTGRYMAVCEGDDFWTDRHKLQKQFDYMEAHPDCTFCFTNGRILDENRGSVRAFIPYTKRDAGLFDPLKEDYDLHDFHRLTFIPTSSFFFRSSCYGELMKVPVRHCPSGDLRLRMFVTSQGYAHFINEKTCLYRENVPGSMMTVWRNQSPEKMFRDSRQNFRMLEDLDKYTGCIYHKGLLPVMATMGAGMLEYTPLREIFHDPVYQELLMAMQTGRRWKTLLKACRAQIMGKTLTAGEKSGGKTDL